MASTQKEHYFYQGRKGKNGHSGPGILVVDGQYKFRLNKTNKSKTIYKMYCNQQGNPVFSCTAKAKVGKRDDGGFFLYSCDDHHNHLANKADVTAEELKQRMGEIVKNSPANPVGEAIKHVKLEAAEEYGEDEDFFKEIVAALGSYHALELRLLRIREKIIGPMPRSRDRFDPRHFLKKIYGKNHKVEVLDSNKLSENWEELVNKANPNSHYNWNNLNDNVRSYEDSVEEDDQGNDMDDERVSDSVTIEDIGSDEEADRPEEPPSPSKKLPKRILAFTSKKLLNLFSQSDRGSLDGTFKSCCKMWSQQFVWMLKYNHHWIPVVWGWLPDKTETSYKVKHIY